ncbi:MAG TPA: type II CAAX endopeptidase family protein [Candidatus Nanopelagicales bacterium]|nr:type II CAAX endopeptidase family protein [Candidatus Nanopelagicales bacterium]
MRRRGGWAALTAALTGAAILAGAPGVGVVIVLLGFVLLTRGLAGATLVLFAVPTAALLLWAASRAGLSLADLGLDRSSVPGGLLWSAAIAVTVLVGLVVAARWHRTRPLFEDARHDGDTGRAVAGKVLVDVPLGTVLVEELAFRGVVLAMLLGIAPTWVAVAVSSVLFGCWHVGAALEDHAANAAPQGRAGTVLRTVLFTGAAGVVFCLLRLVSGSLLPPVALHWLVNGGGLVAAWTLRVGRSAPT